MADKPKFCGKLKLHKRQAKVSKPETESQKGGFMGRLKDRMDRAFHIKQHSKHPESHGRSLSSDDLSDNKHPCSDGVYKKHSEAATRTHNAVDNGVQSGNLLTHRTDDRSSKSPIEAHVEPSFRNELTSKLVVGPQSCARPSKNRSPNGLDAARLSPGSQGSSVRYSLASTSSGDHAVQSGSSSPVSADLLSPTSVTTGMRHRLAVGRQCNRRAPSAQAVLKVNEASDTSFMNFFNSPSPLLPVSETPHIFPDGARDEISGCPASSSELGSKIPVPTSPDSSAASHLEPPNALVVLTDTSKQPSLSCSPNSDSTCSPRAAVSVTYEPVSTVASTIPDVHARRQAFRQQRRTFSGGSEQSQSTVSDSRPKSICSNLSPERTHTPCFALEHNPSDIVRSSSKSPTIGVETPLTLLTSESLSKLRGKDERSSPHLTNDSMVPVSESRVSKPVEQSNTELPAVPSLLNSQVRALRRVKPQQSIEKVQPEDNDDNMMSVSDRASIFGAVLHAPKPAPVKKDPALSELPAKNLGDRRSKVFEIVKNFEQV